MLNRHDLLGGSNARHTTPNVKTALALGETLQDN